MGLNVKSIISQHYLLDLVCCRQNRSSRSKATIDGVSKCKNSKILHMESKSKTIISQELPARFCSFLSQSIGEIKNNFINTRRKCLKLPKDPNSFTGIEPRRSKLKHHISRTTRPILLVSGAIESEDQGEQDVDLKHAKNTLGLQTKKAKMR